MTAVVRAATSGARRGRILILLVITVGGLHACALHAQQIDLCNGITDTPMSADEVRARPLGRWGQECGQAMWEAFAPTRHAKGPRGTVKVTTTFDRHGTPTKADITLSSGSEVLDQRARKTALRTECPPFPRGVKDRETKVITFFHYGEADKGCSAFIPPKPAQE